MKSRNNVGDRAGRASRRSGVSRKTFLKQVGAGIAAAGLGGALAGRTSNAYHPSGESYNPTGGNATITRDEYGVPHIAADTDYDIFYGLGYATAEDRLFQYHTFRLAGSGRLSELLGHGYIEADFGLRAYYTQPKDQLSAQFQALSQEYRDAFTAWIAGFNAYIGEMKQKYLQGDPSLVPFEFLFLGFLPDAFTPEEMMGTGSQLVVDNMVIMNQQTDNLKFYKTLTAVYGEPAGYNIFNDAVWFDDPEAEVTVPSAEGKAFWKRVLGGPGRMPDMSGVEWHFPSSEGMDKVLQKAKASMKLGSMSLAIHQSRSGDHRPLFGGGFQLGYTDAPPLTSEAWLSGGDSGFNMRGEFFGPTLLAGRKEHFNYTSMVGYGANNDWYQETIMQKPDGSLWYLYKEGGNPDPQTDWLPFQPVGDMTDINTSPYPHPRYWDFYYLDEGGVLQLEIKPILKSIHGPLLGLQLGPEQEGYRYGAGFTIKRINYGTEYKSHQMFFGFSLANSFDEFKAAVQTGDANQNVTYTGFRYLVDGKGTDPVIAYFATGAFPERKAPGAVPTSPYNGDPRFPRWGTGEDEWLGTTYPQIESINPSTAFLTNWNSKPRTDFPYGCALTPYWCKGSGVHRIQRGVMAGIQKYGKLTSGEPDPSYYGRDLADILKEIQSNYVRGDHFYYLRPHLLLAEPLAATSEEYDAGEKALLQQAFDIIKDWDLNAFDPPTGWSQLEIDGLLQQGLQLSSDHIKLQATYGDLDDYFDTSTTPPTPLAGCLTDPAGCQAWGAWLQSYGQLYMTWQYKWGLESPGYVIFKKWADKMEEALFPELHAAPVLGSHPFVFSSVPTYGRLLHILDFELSGYSGVPPNQDKDYFGGAEPKQFMLARLMDALVELDGSWDSTPREMRELMASSFNAGFVGAAEWITYCQLISYRTGFGENRLINGNSGFITVNPIPNQANFLPVTLPPGFGAEYVFFDKNMFSQMALTYNFGYKENPLF